MRLSRYGDELLIWQFEFDAPLQLIKVLNKVYNSRITYQFNLEFNASRYVIHNGADEFILEPLIRVNTQAVGRAIKGEVIPDEVNVRLTVTKGDQVLASTYAPVDQSGFIISSITEVTYIMKFEPPTI